MGYRKFYTEATGRKVPKTFTVHHINHDRSDSDILNLVALPQKLHVEYHRSFPRFLPSEHNLWVPEFCDEELLSLEQAAEQLVVFARVREKLKPWVNFRNFLLGYEQKIFKGVGY